MSAKKKETDLKRRNDNYNKQKAIMAASATENGATRSRVVFGFFHSHT
jgi:hypothetical protein